jgi:hypothetical protein
MINIWIFNLIYSKKLPLVYVQFITNNLKISFC